MYQIKSNSKGQITIPKAIREKYGLTAKITRIIYDCDVKIAIEPNNTFFRCHKALPDGAISCLDCPPQSEPIILY